ncbi:hypothetical protein Tco_0857363 [Tanacetum coccineum]|uniref:Uncharacterized protein n=1 Tax=Tanacetum coccineum TaxID=301880 RepID=A0ABQ5BA15_9ASTR
MKWWKMMENLLLFKSKKIAQVVRAWIQSKNSLVKHFEDMRLYRPFKENLQDEGASSERLSVEQPSPSPAPTGEVPNESLPGLIFCFIQKPTCDDLGDHSSNDASLSGNEDDMTLQNVYDLCISLCQPDHRLLRPRKLKLLKANKVTKERASQEKLGDQSVLYPNKGRKESKRTREMVDEDKEFDEDRLSTEDVVSTDKEGVSTDFEKVSTDRLIVSTDESKVSTDEQVESTDESKVSTDEQVEGTEDQSKEEIASKASQTSTQTPTSMTFGDDEIIATLLLNMSKAKIASKERERHRIEETDFVLSKLQEASKESMFINSERAKGSQLTLLLGEELASPRSNSFDEELLSQSKRATGNRTSTSVNG